MKRTILILAAAAVVGLPLSQAAVAREGHDEQGRGRSERHETRREPARREDPRREEPRRDDRRAYERQPAERRDEPRRPPVRSFREESEGRGRWDDRRYDDGPPPDTRAARRGGYLPDSFRGGVVEDYQRYRLRAPPRGYAWVRVNGGFALVSMDDGRIFDMVQ